MLKYHVRYAAKPPENDGDFMKKNTPGRNRNNFKRIQMVLVGAILLMLLTSGILLAAHYNDDSNGESGANLSLTQSGNSPDSAFNKDPDTAASSAPTSDTSSAQSAASTKDTSPASQPTKSGSALASSDSTHASTKETTRSTSAGTGSNGSSPDLKGYVVVLDIGHQKYANSEQEPLGPDMSGTKDKCSSGTAGVVTGRPEYEVNLEIGLKMRDYLKSLGCTVFMTRTTNNVDLSNIDRANFAKSHNPDVYIRLHCDGSNDSSARGVGVFVTSIGNYKNKLPGWGDLLGECFSDATGAKYRGCNAGTTYSGLNWAASIPSFLLEMGYMSNSQDDKLLSDPSYQQKICRGVAEFVSKMPQL